MPVCLRPALYQHRAVSGPAARWTADQGAAARQPGSADGRRARPAPDGVDLPTTSLSCAAPPAGALSRAERVHAGVFARLRPPFAPATMASPQLATEPGGALATTWTTSTPPAPAPPLRPRDDGSRPTRGRRRVGSALACAKAHGDRPHPRGAGRSQRRRDGPCSEPQSDGWRLLVPLHEDHDDVGRAQPPRRPLRPPASRRPPRRRRRRLRRHAHTPGWRRRTQLRPSPPSLALPRPSSAAPPRDWALLPSAHRPARRWAASPRPCSAFPAMFPSRLGVAPCRRGPDW